VSTLLIRSLVFASACLFAAPVSAHDDDPKLLDRQAPYAGPGFRPGSFLAGGSGAGYANAQLQGFGSQAVLTNLSDDHIQYDSSGVELLSWLPLHELQGPSEAAFTGNDCWGYVSPSGREYAIIGLSTGTTFVEISTPSDPVVIQHIDGNNSLWRDVKIFEDYAYVVSEGGGGVQIINLSQIDNGTVTLQSTIFSGGNEDSHNVAIDEDSGYLYRCGGAQGQGLRVYNLNNNPASPQYLGSWNQRYVHDVQVVTYDSGPYAGRQIAFACGGFGNGGTNTGLTIIDVTNKGNMFVRAQHFYPSGVYSHQAWLSGDRTTLFLNDELDEGNGQPTRTIAIDVTDLDAPFDLGSFTNGNKAIGHNLYAKGDRVFEANYRSGLRIFDSPNPPSATEVAYFDTWPGDDAPHFNGLWSCYPFFPSGVVIGSDMERGLFVWWVGDPKLTFDLPNGEPLLIDPAGDSFLVQLNEDTAGDLQAGSAKLFYDIGAGIVESPLVSQGGGSYLASFPAFECGTQVNWFVGANSTDGIQWTFPSEAPYNSFDSTAVEAELVLYEDDMEVDAGWTAGEPDDTATAGLWILEDPKATDGSTGDDHSVNGTKCWQTGVTSDVSNGFTTLTSPVYDLSGQGDPVLSFWLWFRRVGLTQGTDSIRIRVSDNGGVDWVQMEVIKDISEHLAGAWMHQIYRLSDWITPSDTVQLRLIVQDDNLNTTVEALIDDLRIVQYSCGCSIETYCSSSLNSNGTAAQISYSGTAEIGQANFTLNVSGAVPGNLGLFFYGPGQTQLPLGEGTLCVASGSAGIQRLQFPLQLDGTGAASRYVDYNASPADMGPGAISAGSNWNFQFWYRDPAGGPGGSNLSDALEVTFCP
jgi:choice-of-anchor B domain-containing protein